MDYTEYTFTTPSPEISEIIIVELAELGFESFVDNDNGFQAYIQLQMHTNEVIDTIKKITQKFSGVTYSALDIKNENWNSEWEKNFSPIDVDGKCLVRASFHQPIDSVLYDIIIDPKMSFGTGHHETTYQMIKEMLGMEWSGKSVCDMGCGTSVLAVLAAKMGAENILAVDIDEWSVENSKENILTNNTPNIIVEQGNVKNIATKLFDIILANINRNILLSDIPLYVESLNKQGHLLLSGFFETDIPAIQQKAEEAGMKLTNTLTRNKWAMLHFTNKA